MIIPDRPYYHTKEAVMGLFKPKGLGKTVTCSVCGKKLYLLEDHSTAAQLPLMNKVYRFDSVYRCEGCGKYTCQNCKMFALSCRCGSGRMTVLPAARK